jgi:hypothetical protein
MYISQGIITGYHEKSYVLFIFYLINLLTPQNTLLDFKVNGFSIDRKIHLPQE